MATNKLVQKIIDSDVLDIIENHPELSDSAIMSILVYGGITRKTADYA